MLDKVQEWLQARDMGYEMTEPNVIATAFSTRIEDGPEQGFPLFILSIEDGYGNEYIRFAIVPYIEQPYEGYTDSLPLLLAQINHDLPQLKFAFDGDGDLELIFDIPFNQVEDLQLDIVLQVIANYAGLYYADLGRIH